MLRKIFFSVILLNIFSVVLLAIFFPEKNQHLFRESNGIQTEEYHEQHWKVLPPSGWGLDINPPRRVGCGPLGSGGDRVIRFGCIGIRDNRGWRTTKEELNKRKIQKAKENSHGTRV